MSKIIKILFPSLVICYLTFVICSAAPAASKADLKKFPPVAGEVFGQAAAGVKSMSVNGRPVALDASQNFRTTVNLGRGEKYLTLRINYEGLRIIKKYLILRRPQVKTFKVFVPKEKIEKTIQVAKSSKKKLLQPRRLKKLLEAKKMPPPKPQKPAISKTFEYLYVWEFSAGKLLLVKETRGNYSAEIHIPVSKKWLDLKGLSRQELKELITPSGRKGGN
jgi:hypothetical protein